MLTTAAISDAEFDALIDTSRLDRPALPVRFMIERPTPQSVKPGRHDPDDDSARHELQRALPLIVQVHYHPEPRKDYNSSCGCREVYRLTVFAVGFLRRRGMLRGNLNGKAPCVCDCMGMVLDL